ncbi:MAG: cytochrome c [Gemmatimonadetes bacterium]|nr:cytochrome c [Gemmatimonadota bacterium]
MRPAGKGARAVLGHRGARLGQATLVLLALAACGRERPADAKRLAALQAPSEHLAGEALYNANCSACHGLNAGGTAHGPPLVDAVYRPGHHGDAAFLLAAKLGVKAHHWRFGDMPPAREITDADMAYVTRYVRWLQREMGIE